MSTKPTQVLHSWRATLRTVAQVLAALIFGLFGLILALAAIAPEFLDALAAILPPDWYAWAVTAVTFIVTLAGVVTKIMAIPKVNDWLTRHRMGAAPMIDARDSGKITSL